MSRAFIDITREVCPMTWVRVKLRLESLAPGELLEVRLKGDEPLRNLPRNAIDDGHFVRSLERDEQEVVTLVLEVGVP